jgi:streptogramin lyase
MDLAKGTGNMRLKLLLLAVAIASLVMLAGVVVASAGDVAVEEADLKPYGEVYEINLGSDGQLYLSDYGSYEIWRVDPDTSHFTTYGLSGVADGVVDARPDSAGNIWWTDYANGFGKVDVLADTVTEWTLAEGLYLGGLAFDGDGKVWTTEWLGDELYSFDPASTEVCTHTLPGGTSSFYVLYLYDEDLLWLGNWGEDRIVAFDPSTNGISWWQLEVDSTPNGLAVDGSGNYWWADNTLGVLGRLEPDLDQLTTYSLPLGTAPQMIAIDGDKLWYSESNAGTVGLLDPAVAAGSITTLSTGSDSASVVCSALGPGSTEDVAQKSSGVVSWDSGTWTTVVDENGWTVYELPNDPSPYGIAISSGYVWVTDQGTQKLVRLGIAPGYKSYIPLVLK